MSLGFVAATSFLSGVSNGPLATKGAAASAPFSHAQSRPVQVITMAGPSPGGLFGKMLDGIQAKLVKTPGVTNSEVEQCPFCMKGSSDCVACKGSGKDALGTCLMCDGKKVVTCSVCNGVGKVDSVRRGGTDLGGNYLGKRGRKSSKKKMVWTCNATGAVCGCNKMDESRLPLEYNGEGPMTEEMPDNKLIFACACGRSTMWPFCSGMHKAVNEKEGTSYKPFEIESIEAKDVQLCRCGHSENRPLCDGTHSMLQKTAG